MLTSKEVLLPPADTGGEPPESYTDPRFGTTVRRVSDAKTTSAGWVGVEYSSICPYGKSGLFLLLHNDHFALYGQDGFIRDLPIGASSRPKWNLWSPHVICFLDGDALVEMDVRDSARDTVAKFPGMIDDGGEADFSEDGAHLVLSVGGAISVYSFSDRKLLGDPLRGHSFESLYLTPDSNVIVSWNQNGTERFCGMELFDREMKFIRQIATCNSHKDVTRDANGREVLVWSNGDENPVTLTDYPNGLIISDLATGKQRGLLSLDWALAVHVSCPDDSGFAIISTQYGGDEASWPPYANEIIELPLDGSPAKRRCHHRSKWLGYLSQPHASVSRDGKRVLLNSNWGSGKAGYVDVYELVLEQPEGVQPAPSAVIEPPVPIIEEEPKLTKEQVMRGIDVHWKEMGN